MDLIGYISRIGTIPSLTGGSGSASIDFPNFLREEHHALQAATMASLAPCRIYARSCLLETLPYKTVKLKYLSKTRCLSTSLAVNAENPSSLTEPVNSRNSQTSPSETENPPTSSDRPVLAPQLPDQTNFPSATPPATPSAAPTKPPVGYVSRVRREPPPPSVLPPRYRPDSPDDKTTPRYEDQTHTTSKSSSDNLVRRLPNSSHPEPVIPANASLFPRVSLAPDSFSKIPARMWGKRPGDTWKGYNPFAPIRLDKESKEGNAPTLYENSNWDAIQEIRNREKLTRPPVPTSSLFPLSEVG